MSVFGEIFHNIRIICRLLRAAVLPDCLQSPHWSTVPFKGSPYAEPSNDLPVTFIAKIYMWANCLEKIWSLQWSRQSRQAIFRTLWTVPIISSSSVELDYPQRKICQPSFILKIKLCYKPPEKNKQMGIKIQSRNSFIIKSESVDETPCLKSSVESGF